MTRAEASNMIDERYALLQAFRQAHNNEKWATGRQRAALKKRGINKNFDTMTMEKAKTILHQAYKKNKQPPTQKQVDLLTKKGYTGPPPATLHEASELFANLISSEDKATPAQLKFIRERNMAPNIDLNKLTKSQARAVINAFLRRGHAPRTPQKTTTKQSNRQKPPPDSDSEPDSEA